MRKPAPPLDTVVPWCERKQLLKVIAEAESSGEPRAQSTGNIQKRIWRYILFRRAQKNSRIWKSKEWGEAKNPIPCTPPRGEVTGLPTSHTEPRACLEVHNELSEHASNSHLAVMRSASHGDCPEKGSQVSAIPNRVEHRKHYSENATIFETSNQIAMKRKSSVGL